MIGLLSAPLANWAVSEDGNFSAVNLGFAIAVIPITVSTISMKSWFYRLFPVDGEEDEITAPEI